MIVLKVATIFLLALAVRAEKKIELQDIEEDNLRSEKESDGENSDARPQNSAPGTGPELVPLEYLKSGILRYFEKPTPPPQQQRYVHQYDVTEPPERSSPPVATVQYTQQAAPQQVVGYLSNVPMQVYLVPQYYTEQSHQQVNHHSPHVQYQPAVARVAAYQTAPEAVQTQTNYVEVPSYVAPTGKTYVQQYTPPVTYVGYQAHPTIAPAQPTVAPVVTYQVPVAIQYTPAVAQPTTAPKQYYQHHQYTETNSVDDTHDHHEDDQRQYSTQTEVPYHKPASEFPRHYNSRVPIREDYRPHPNAITELPHPNPLIFKSPPPHLTHVPKALPVYRPIQRPVYQPAASHVSGGYTPRPHEVYGPPPPFKRRPTSLLDSYIPSSIQVEYLKRGLIKDPSAVYDALASGRLPHPIPRNYERGFLPNQMYHTGAGGVTFGHYKRSPKLDKIPHN